MRTSIIPALLFCGMLFAVPNAHASLLSNGSFEVGGFVPDSDQTMSLPIGSSVMTGWTVTNDKLAWIGTGNPWSLTASNGAKFLDLTDCAKGAPFGGVSQTITTVVGTSYELSFDLGSATRFGPPSAIQASAAGSSQIFTGAATGGINDWQRFSMQFTASSPTTVVSLLGITWQYYIGLDNVDVVAAHHLPEPASLAVWSMLSMVGIGCCWWRKRRG